MHLMTSEQAALFAFDCNIALRISSGVEVEKNKEFDIFQGSE